MKDEDMAEEGLNKRLGTMGYLNKQNVAKPYTDGFKDGFKACAKERLNATTISDCPIKDDRLTKATEIIKRMLPLLPQGYNDMGNSNCVWETRNDAEQFLKEV